MRKIKNCPRRHAQNRVAGGSRLQERKHTVFTDEGIAKPPLQYRRAYGRSVLQRLYAEKIYEIVICKFVIGLFRVSKTREQHRLNAIHFRFSPAVNRTAFLPVQI